MTDKIWTDAKSLPGWQVCGSRRRQLGSNGAVILELEYTADGSHVRQILPILENDFHPVTRDITPRNK